MSEEVKSFLENLGARKYETTPYKPSLESFHRFLTSAISLCIDDMDGKGTDQNQWDEHLDTVLLTYRVLPIDGLDVSPFEIIYGRGPNLPIDNILFRENYTGFIYVAQNDSYFPTWFDVSGLHSRRSAHQMKRNWT